MGYLKLEVAAESLFCVYDATQALADADALPAGTIYKNGTADALTVTVAKISTGLYKATFTPAVGGSFAAGDNISLGIAATVGGIATGAIVGEWVLQTNDIDTVDGVVDGIKTKTDSLNFTGTDVKATLDSEKVTVTSNEDKTGYSLHADYNAAKTAAQASDITAAHATTDGHLTDIKGTGFAKDTDSLVNLHDFKVFGAGDYDANTGVGGTFTIVAFLHKNGVVVAAPTSCVATVYDNAGSEVFSVNDASHTQGFFTMTKTNPGFAANTLYALKTAIVSGGVTYTSLRALQVRN